MSELRINDAALQSLSSLEIEKEDVKEKAMEEKDMNAYTINEMDDEELDLDDMEEVAISKVIENEAIKVQNMENFRVYSDSIEIINTLGYSEKGTFTDITQNVLANAANSNPNIKVYPYTSATKGRGSNRGKTSWVKVDKKNGKILEGELYRRVDNKKFIVPYQYSEDGVAYNIVRRKGTAAVTKNNMCKYRRCQTVPKIIGYIIRNCGDEVVDIETEKWHYDANEEKYVSNGVEVVQLKPGETMQISKTYLILNASKEEFNCKFKNGVIACSDKKAAGTVEERLQHYFFKFSKESKLDVHSEDVKCQIADKITHEDGSLEWVIKDKYLETFGYIMNNRIIEKTKKKESKSDKGGVDDASSRIAETIRSMMAGVDDGGQL